MKAIRGKVYKEGEVDILGTLARGVTPTAKKWFLGWIASTIVFTPTMLLALPKGFNGQQSFLGFLCFLLTILSAAVFLMTSVVMILIVFEGIWIALKMKYSGFFRKISAWIEKDGL